MANIIDKLYTQAVAKVGKELELERDRRVKLYLTKAIRTLVREGIIDADEAKAASSKYGLSGSDISSTPSTDGGCGSQSRGNRC